MISEIEFYALDEGDILIPNVPFVMNEGGIAFDANQPYTIIETRFDMTGEDDVAFISRCGKHWMEWEDIKDWTKK